ncbi:MAG: glycosyltransferase [Parvibaculales bacterium]
MMQLKANYLKLSSKINILLVLLGPIASVSVNALPALLGLCGLLAFFEMKKNRVAWRPRVTNISLAGSAFILYVMLSSFWSPDMSQAIIQSLQFVALLIPAILLIRYIDYLDVADIEKMGRAMRYGIALAMLILFFETYLDQPFYRFWLDKFATDRSFDPRHLERSVAVFTLFLFFIAAHTAKRTSLTGGLIMLGLWAAFCLKFGFIPEYIGILSGATFLSIALILKRPAKVIIFALLVLQTVLIVPVSLKSHDTHFVQNLLSFPPGTNETLDQIVKTYFAVSELILEKPVFGHGLQSASSLQEIKTAEIANIHSLHPHNYTLQIMLETGYVGSLLFLFFLYFMLQRMNFNIVKTEAFMIGAIGCNLTITSFTFGIWQSWWMSSIIFVIMCFILELGSKNSQKNVPVQNRKLRIMHAIFSHGYRGSESALAVIANEQVKTHPVSVMVRSDCDARDGPSILDALDPDIDIIKVPNFLRALCANMFILKWQPDVFHAHLGRAVRLKTWLKPNMLRVSSMHIFSPHHHVGQDRIICISDWQMGALPESLHLKSRLVRNATPSVSQISQNEKDALRRELGISPETRIVGFVGAINTTKGANIAVEAFAKAGMEDTHLLMIGEGPLRQELTEKTADMDNVTLTGYKDNARDYMQIMDILLLPSNWAEPFMLSLIEGMEAGCWVITIDSFGPGDIMRQQPHGCVVSLNDTDGFAQALQAAPKDSGIRYEYNLEKYAFSKHISGIFKIYEDAFDPLSFKT